MILLQFNMRPEPKERPRLGRNDRAYTPKKTAAAESFIAMVTRTEMNRRDVPAFQGDVGLDIEFDRTGYKRADIDNMVKLLMDGLQKGGAYLDDKQVTSIKARVRYGCKTNLIRVFIGATNGR